MSMQYRRVLGRRAIHYIAYILTLIFIVSILSILHNQLDLRTHRARVEDLRDASSSQQHGSSNMDYNHLDDRVERTISRCETIHLAIVCGGINSTRSFYVLLKSILFYRTDVIHLHLFVDSVSHVILHKLFETWLVSDMSISYYNITAHEQEISWITSNHYSRKFGLMKLVFLPVLANQSSTDKVILLDTDMLVLGNINQVWKKFEVMKANDIDIEPIFGMVENQSDWYLSDNQLIGTQIVWPAMGRGFNTGLIMANLIEIKRQNWKGIWRQVAESELTTHLSTPLADQDIFNAVIRLHSYMIYQLPCSFNLQLNDHTKLDEICPSGSEFKIVHWNSPYKLSSKNPKNDFFRDWYLTFTNWDGKLLEQSYCGGSMSDNSLKLTANSSDNLENICKDIQPRPTDTLRVYLYFLQFECEPSEFDVTLVVHLSLDRLQVLDQLSSHWSGPISAAIYMSELETNLFMELIRSSNNLIQRKNVGYHLVFRDHGFSYPINRLRNIALNNAITPYVFLSDVDFLPSKNLYEYLKQIISDMTTQDGVADPLARRALVIPAFENSQYKFEFPSTKMELLTQLNLGSVSMFRDQIWPRGQAPTNYVKWRSSTKPYKVDWRPDYEPFIVTSRNVPRFDERFVGFGWNKVENVVLLAAMKYEFIVLPEAFVIHKFHSASFDIMKHRESVVYRACIKQLKRLFLAELKSKFPNFFHSLTTTREPVNSK